MISCDTLNRRILPALIFLDTRVFKKKKDKRRGVNIHN